MAANTIVLRVYDFLKGFPPFNKLEKEELLFISEKVEVVYFKKDDFVFRQADPPGKFFYCLKNGSVELSHSTAEGDDLVDVCDEGDIFGVRSMISGKPYLLNARVREDCLLYAIPIAVFQPYLQSNPKVSLYFAAGLATGQINADPIHGKDFSLLNDQLSEQERHQNLLLSGIFHQDTSGELVKCMASTKIRDAATLMSEKNVGSIIICSDDGRPIGIVTDTDFRRKIVTGLIPVEAPIESIMASPVITIHRNASVIEILLIMLSKGVHHLCITEDGTNDSVALGMVSQSDLTVMQGNSPLLLFREIKRADTVSKIQHIRDRAEKLIERYLKQEASIQFISQLITAINDELLKKAIRFAESELLAEGFKPPNLTWCWLSLGSEGRQEQLLRTDQDNALVYENPAPGDESHAAKYFLALGKKVTAILMSCGFEKCPSDMMASNEKWNVPLSVWKSYFEQWINTPEPKALMLATIFFDYRPVAGDSKLASKLDKFLKKQIIAKKIFLNFFALNATQNPPPLSFIGGFVEERNGDHKNEFDIKLRAMMPLVDAARVLTLDKLFLDEKRTIRRFEKMALDEPHNAGLFQDAAKSYEILMRFRALNGFANNNSGRYIDISKLTKIDKQILKSAFGPIEKLQKLLRVRFQLDYFT